MTTMRTEGLKLALCMMSAFAIMETVKSQSAFTWSVPSGLYDYNFYFSESRLIAFNNHLCSTATSYVHVYSTNSLVTGFFKEELSETQATSRLYSHRYVCSMIYHASVGNYIYCEKLTFDHILCSSSINNCWTLRIINEAVTWTCGLSSVEVIWNPSQTVKKLENETIVSVTQCAAKCEAIITLPTTLLITPATTTSTTTSKEISETSNVQSTTQSNVSGQREELTEDNKDAGNSDYIIIGLAAGLAVLAIVIIILSIFLLKSRRKSTPGKRVSITNQEDSGPNGASNNLALHNVQNSALNNEPAGFPTKVSEPSYSYATVDLSTKKRSSGPENASAIYINSASSKANYTVEASEMSTNECEYANDNVQQSEPGTEYSKLHETVRNIKDPYSALSAL